MVARSTPRKAVRAARFISALFTTLALPAAARAGEPEGPPPALTIEASLITDIATVASGDSRGTAAIARADARAIVDGAGFGASGFSAMLGVAAYSGSGVSGRTLGDVQGTSSLEADAALRVINAWVGWTGDHLAVKAGVIDTNADFDEQNVAATFLNASHGMGPEFAQAGPNGPGVNPASGLGAVVSVFDTPRGLKLRAGLFAGRSGDPANPRRLSWGIGGDDGTLALAEADWTGPRLRIAVGGWRFSALQPRIDGSGLGRGSHGGYVLVEGRIAGAADGLRLDGWLRHGRADRALSPVTSYLGGGLVARGFAGLPADDTVGLAFARATPNPASGIAKAETNLELTAQVRLDGHTIVQPDLQLVLHPGGVPGRPAALVPGLRLIVVR